MIETFLKKIAATVTGWYYPLDMDSTLLRKDIPWDEVENEQIENKNYKEIGSYLMKEMVEGKIIRVGSASNRCLARLNECPKASFIKTKIHRDSVLYDLFLHEEAASSEKRETGWTQKGTWVEMSTSAAIS